MSRTENIDSFENFEVGQTAKGLCEGYGKLGKQLNAYPSWLESKIVRESPTPYGGD